MGILGAIIIGFIVGIIAKLITPGDPKPRGFILTTVLGIVGALLATWLGQFAAGEARRLLNAAGMVSVDTPAKAADGVSILTLNRPDSRNALTTELLRGLADELLAIQDSPRVRAVLLAGAGDTFCAGADLKEFAPRRPIPSDDRPASRRGY